MKKIIGIFVILLCMPLVVHAEETIFPEGTLHFEVIDTQVPVYDLQKGDLHLVGYLTKGAVVKREKSAFEYHQVIIQDTPYFIPQKGTIQTNKEGTLETNRIARFPNTLVAERDTLLRLSDGTAFGMLKKNQSIQLLGISKNKGIAYFVGREVSLNLSDFVHMNALQPKKKLTYAEVDYMTKMVSLLYPEFTNRESIGKSVEGRDIIALKVGTGKKEIIIDGSVHAREHMTTNVIMEMIDMYTYHYARGTKYAGYSTNGILNKTSIWFVPMVNPDGVTLVQSGAKAVKNGTLATKINGSMNFNRWKANVRGVDINENFDSTWKEIKGPTKPSYMKYKGPKVFSEPESVALRDFINNHNFKTYLSYHTAGRVLYYWQYQKTAELNRDLALTKTLRNLTGYSIMNPMYIVGSGASTDWFIDTKKMPGIVLEIAPYNGEAPVALSHWDRVWYENHKVGLYAALEASTR